MPEGRIMTVGATLQIGAMGVQFHPESPKALCRFIPPYAAFVRDGVPHVVLDVSLGPPPLPGVTRPTFDNGSTWCLVKDHGSVSIYGHPYADLAEWNDVGLVMRPDFTQGTLYIYRPESEQTDGLENPLRYPLDQVLMIHLLAQGRGLLLHASAMLDGGKGYLFAGSSGRGKSTMARLWDGKATILSDDRIILRQQREGFWMYGTPWHGTYPALSPEGCRLSEIFLLAHGPENSLRLLSGAEAAARLLIASFPPLWDREGMAWTLELLDRLTASVPVYGLTFRPDFDVVPFVRQAVGGPGHGPDPA